MFTDPQSPRILVCLLFFLIASWKMGEKAQTYLPQKFIESLRMKILFHENLHSNVLNDTNFYEMQSGRNKVNENSSFRYFYFQWTYKILPLPKIQKRQNLEKKRVSKKYLGGSLSATLWACLNHNRAMVSPQ